ncbi:MAG: hypothetical protein ACE5J5_02530 [Candidatus Hydrothermarchaeales archaeon]
METNDKTAMLPVGDLFFKTNMMFQRHWKPLLSISALYAAMAFLIDISTSILLRAVFLFTAFWVNIALVVALENLEEPGIISKSFKEGLRLLIPYTILSVAYGISVAVGLIILIIPGILLAVWLSLFEYVMVFEEKRYLKAFTRSKELVEGYSFEVFSRFLIFTIIWFVIAIVLRSIPYFGSILLDLIFFPYITIYFFVIYKDLSKIKGS